jgi:hypothetical protein
MSYELLRASTTSVAQLGPVQDTADVHRSPTLIPLHALRGEQSITPTVCMLRVDGRVR